MKNSAKKFHLFFTNLLYYMNIIINAITVKNTTFFFEKFTQLLHFCNIILEHCMALPWPFQWLV